MKSTPKNLPSKNHDLLIGLVRVKIAVSSVSSLGMAFMASNPQSDSPQKRMQLNAMTIPILII